MNIIYGLYSGFLYGISNLIYYQLIKPIACSSCQNRLARQTSKPDSLSNSVTHTTAPYHTNGRVLPKTKLMQYPLVFVDHPVCRKVKDGSGIPYRSEESFALAKIE